MGKSCREGVPTASLSEAAFHCVYSYYQPFTFCEGPEGYNNGPVGYNKQVHQLAELLSTRRVI